MNEIQKWAVGMVIHWAVSELSTTAKTLDWGTINAETLTKIRTHVGSPYLASAAGTVVHEALDIIAKVMADTDTIEAELKALAAQDWPGAETALKSEVEKYASPELAKVLSAA